MHCVAVLMFLNFPLTIETYINTYSTAPILERASHRFPRTSSQNPLHCTNRLCDLLARLSDLHPSLPSLHLDLPLDDLVRVGGDDGVLLDVECHNLGENSNESHEEGGGDETGHVARCIGRWPKEDTVDGGGVTESVDQGDGDGSLLGGESDDVRDPNEGEGADAVD